MSASPKGGSSAASAAQSDGTTMTIPRNVVTPHSVASGILEITRNSMSPTRLSSRLYGKEEEEYALEIQRRKASERENTRK
jgi:hypothetical protein